MKKIVLSRVFLRFTLIFIFLEIILKIGKISTIFFFQLYTCNSRIVNLPVILDVYRLVFGFTVTLIRTNVLVFSMFYMKEENFTHRFVIILLIFVGSIIFLIFVPRFIILMIG